MQTHGRAGAVAYNPSLIPPLTVGILGAVLAGWVVYRPATWRSRHAERVSPSSNG